MEQKENMMNEEDTMHEMPEGQDKMQKSNKKQWVPWTILAVVLIVVLAGVGYMYKDKILKTQSNLSGYQAVFLANGAAYYGKISDRYENYIHLTDVYYLQQTNGQQQVQPPQFALVKLGGELQGSTDEMFINRSQVLLYENLRADGQVSKAIAAQKKNPNAIPNQSPQNQQIPLPQAQ